MPATDPIPPKAPRTGAFCFGRWRAAALVLVALAAPALAAVGETARVAEVFDGDTVRLADGRQLRLIGINTPEFGRDGRPDEPLAAPARERLAALVAGRTVRLEYEAERHDRHGRTLAHLRLADGTRVEEPLLREGLAFAIAIPPNVGQIARLRAAEDEARRARRGLWAHTYYEPRPAARLTTGDTGFRRVHGRVERVGRSRRYLYFDLGPRFAVRIGHADWARYFGGRPEDWQGAAIEARGWISSHQGRLYLGVGHPAMIERTR